MSRIGIGTLLVSLACALSSCGKEEHHDDHGHGDHAHGHAPAQTGPNGGDLTRTGEGTTWLETVIDHDTATLVLVVHRGNDPESLEPLPIEEPPVLLVGEAAAPQRVTGRPFADLVPEGSAWRFETEALRSEPETLKVELTRDGETQTVELAHAH